MAANNSTHDYMVGGVAENIGFWLEYFPWPKSDLWMSARDHCMGKLSAMG